MLLSASPTQLPRKNRRASELLLLSIVIIGFLTFLPPTLKRPSLSIDCARRKFDTHNQGSEELYAEKNKKNQWNMRIRISRISMVSRRGFL